MESTSFIFANKILCNACKSFVGYMWYKCLNCPVVICKNCHDNGHPAYEHPASHAQQSILEAEIEQKYAHIYTCPWCGVSFLTIDGIYDHIVDTHPAPRQPRIVYCPICMTIPEMRFKKTSDIAEHMRVEHNCFTRPKSP